MLRIYLWQVYPGRVLLIHSQIYIVKCMVYIAYIHNLFTEVVVLCRLTIHCLTIRLYSSNNCNELLPFQTSWSTKCSADAGSILSKPVKWNIIHGATQPWDKVVNYEEAKIREFQGSTPRCLGPNLHPYPHNTHTCTPKGVGVPTLCGFTLGWGWVSFTST